MHSDINNTPDSPQSPHSSPTCYFSIVPPESPHVSVGTPSTALVAEYSSDISAGRSHPLLAFRPLSPEYCLAALPMDASKLLQLQTAAAHSRPAAQPLQHSASASSTNSNSSTSSGSNSPSPPMLCCCRCRRESTGHNGMVRFGTNLYYCNHCANMVGYATG